MQLQPDLLPPGEGGRKAPVGNAERLLGKEVRKGPGFCRRKALHRMGQHVKARVRNESGGQFLQKVAVEDRQVRPEPLVHQRVLGVPVGQYGKIRYLRPGARGGGHRRQRKTPLAEIGHGLGAVQGAAAPQGHQQIRSKGLQLRRPPGRQLHRRVRLDIRKISCLRASGSLRYLLGQTVFEKERVRHNVDPLCPKLLERTYGPGPGNHPGAQREFFHSPTAFSMASMSGMEKSIRKPVCIFSRIWYDIQVR